MLSRANITKLITAAALDLMAQVTRQARRLRRSTMRALMGIRTMGMATRIMGMGIRITGVRVLDSTLGRATGGADIITMAVVGMAAVGGTAAA